ncbi:MAG: choice-of-anchor L domain-containing protein [Aquaticitalea sp.]
MRKLIQLSLFFFLFSLHFSIAQSIIVENPADAETAYNAEQLVNNVLIGNDCAGLATLTTPITDYGNWGYFTRGTTNFPFERGVILSTGLIANAQGPNNNTQAGTNIGRPGDTDLAQILNAANGDNYTTYDATAFMFTFIPLIDVVSLNFIFASEEYEDNYECNSQYRDGFAFLVRGPGIPNDSGTAFGGTNIASVTGSAGVPVNTYSIHDNSFTCGGEVSGTNFFPNLYVSNSGINNTNLTQFDGYTTILTATVNVIPNQVYTMKMVIADRGDSVLDSAVFLEAGSLNIGTLSLGDDILIANQTAICEGDIITLDSGINPSTVSSINWFLDGGIIPGENNQTLAVTEDGEYTVVITYSLGCFISDAVIIEFIPVPSIDEINNVQSCDTFTLPAITGSNLTGNEHYYTGTNGTGTAFAIGSTINFADFASYPVTLYMYDESATTPNCIAEESFTLTINECTISVTVTANNAIICSADNTTVTLTATPNPAAPQGTYSYSWNELGSAAVLGTNQTLNVTPTITTTYQVTLIDSGIAVPNNTSTANVTITVINTPQIDALANQVFFDSYTLPTITGSNLTGNEQYYTGPNGTGTAYASGTTFNFADFASYPVTLYIYDATATTPNCIDEESFTLILNQSPTGQVCGFANPNMDSFTTCSNNHSQINRVGNWVAVSQTTPDFTCDCGTGYWDSLWGTCPTFAQNFIGGFGYTLNGIGNIWSEYIGQCLPTPVLAGDTCVIEFDIFQSKGTGTHQIQVYGFVGNTCPTLPIATRDDIGLEPGWEVIGSAEETSSPTDGGFSRISITVTTTNAYSFLAFGEVQRPNPGINDVYFVYDNFCITKCTPPSATAPPNLEVCDGTSNDGFATFDLTSQNATVLGSQSATDFTVRYFTDAAGINEITGTDLTAFNNTTNPQTIFVTVEENNATSCFNDTVSFELIVNILPVANQPNDLEECDSGSSNVGTFDLTSQNANILGSQTAADFTVHYYTDAALLNEITGSDLTAFNNTSNPQTIYVLVQTNTTPNCTDANSFTVSITTAPVINPVSDVTQCNSFTLPVIMGSNLTGNEQYYTATNGTGTAYASGTTINFADFTSYPVTLYMYDATATTPICFGEESFTLTINQSPSADAPINVNACDSYTLPALSNGNNYYTGTNATGSLLSVGEMITTSQTIYVFAQTNTTPNCTDENSFTVTIATSPVINSVSDVTECNSFTLPVITGNNLTGNQQYYTGTNGTGTAYASGTTLNFADFASYPVTLYIYDETATTHNCITEESFTLTLNECTISVTATANNAVICSADNTTVTLTATPNPAAPLGTYSYSWNELGSAVILGTNQTLNVTPTVTTTYQVTLTDSGIAAPNNVSTSNITVTVNNTPQIDTVANQVHCDSYTLPTITGSNLTGNEQYYTGPNANGTAYASGTTLNFSDFASYPVTLYMYDATATTPNCFDEESFTLTINQSPTADAPINVNACDSYTLPALSSGNNYYTGINGSGSLLNAGDVISTSQTIYIFAQTNTTPNCTDENSFTVTIATSPVINSVSDVTQCNSFTLPVITGNNLTGNQQYYTGTNGTGTAYASGTTLNYADFASYPVTLYMYDVTATTPNCLDEETFTLTINECTISVTVTANNAIICSADNTTVTLTATPNPAAPQGTYSYSWNELGSAAVLGTNQTLNVTPTITTTYQVTLTESGIAAPNNFATSNITVTVNDTPQIDALVNQVHCDSYTLPTITGSNLTGNEHYYTGPNGTGTAYTSGTTLNFADFASYPVTLYMYDVTATTPNCLDEETFTLTINECTISVTVTANNAIICSADNTTVTLTATPNPAAPQGTYSYSWNELGSAAVLGTNQTLNVTPTITTTYQVTLTDSGIAAPNNIATSNVTVTVNDTPQIDALANQVHCDSYTLPTITGNNLTGNEQYYTATNGTGTAYASSTTINFADFTSYPVTLYMYDATATTPICFGEESFTLTINQCTFSVITIANNAVICSADNTTVTLTATPNPVAPQGTYSYSWNEIGSAAVLGTNQILNVTPTATTTYQVTLTDSGIATPNNVATSDVTVTVNDTPQIDTVANQVHCDSYTLPTITGSNLTGNEHYYTGPNGTGTAYTSGTTLNFADFASYPVTLYMYDATATIPNCFDEESFTLAINECTITVTATANNAVICFADNTTVTLTATPNPVAPQGTYSYSWNELGSAVVLGTNQILNVTPTLTTTYQVTLTDSGIAPPNNIATSNITVTVNNTPQIDALANQVHCDSYTLPTITGNNLTGNEQYYTGTSGTGTAYASGTTINFVDFASYPVTLYMYDTTATIPNCFDEVSFNLTINECIISITATANNAVICSTDNTIVTLTATPNPAAPLGTYSYSWNEHGSAVVLGTNQTLNVTPTATTTYQVTLTDSGVAAPNNAATSNITVTVNNTPQIDALPNQVHCDSYILPTITGSNLTGNEQYYTGPNATGTAYASGTTLNFSDFVSYPVTLYMYDATATTPNCFDEESFTLTLYQSSIADSPINVSACDAYTLPTLSSGNNYYTGTNGSGSLLNAGDVIFNSQTIYVFAENNTNTTCTDENSFTVTINPSPIVELEESYTICLDSTGSVNGPITIETDLSELDYTFVWTDNNNPALVLNTSSSFEPTQAGIYTVVVTDNVTGCQGSDSTSVSESGPPIVDATVTSEDFADNHSIVATIIGTGVYEFSLDGGPWVTNTPNDNTYTFVHVTPGEHTITARDMNGCGVSSDDVLIIDYPVFFTPNGDTYNENWNVIGLSNQPSAKIYIFDRFGKLLKQLSPTSKGWDGTYNENPLPSTDYWFTIEYKNPDGAPKVFKAHFALKR